MASMTSAGEITLLLRKGEAGRERALDQLMALVHTDLERMAHAFLHKQFGERAKTITLEPAALVNESSLQIIRQRAPKLSKMIQLF